MFNIHNYNNLFLISILMLFRITTKPVKFKIIFILINLNLNWTNLFCMTPFQIVEIQTLKDKRKIFVKPLFSLSHFPLSSFLNFSLSLSHFPYSLLSLALHSRRCPCCRSSSPPSAPLKLSTPISQPPPPPIIAAILFGLSRRP